MVRRQLLLFIAALLSLSLAARPDPADHEQQYAQQRRSGQSLLAVGQRAEMHVVKESQPSSFFQEALDRASVLFDEVARTLTASKLEQVENKISNMVRAQNQERGSAHANPCEVRIPGSGGKMAPDSMLEALALCINHLDLLAKKTHDSAHQSLKANEKYVEHYKKADAHLTVLEANELAKKFKTDHVRAYCALHEKLCDIKADFHHINNMPRRQSDTSCLNIKECGSGGTLPGMHTNHMNHRVRSPDVESGDGSHYSYQLLKKDVDDDEDTDPSQNNNRYDERNGEDISRLRMPSKEVHVTKSPADDGSDYGEDPLDRTQVYKSEGEDEYEEGVDGSHYSFRLRKNDVNEPSAVSSRSRGFEPFGTSGSDDNAVDSRQQVSEPAAVRSRSRGFEPFGTSGSDDNAVDSRQQVSEPSAGRSRSDGFQPFGNSGSDNHDMDSRQQVTEPSAWKSRSEGFSPFGTRASDDQDMGSRQQAGAPPSLPGVAPGATPRELPSDLEDSEPPVVSPPSAEAAAPPPSAPMSPRTLPAEESHAPMAPQIARDYWPVPPMSAARSATEGAEDEDDEELRAASARADSEDGDRDDESHGGPGTTEPPY